MLMNKQTIICFMLAVSTLALSSCGKKETTLQLYFGTYGDSLYRYEFNLTDNSFRRIAAAAINSPSYVGVSEGAHGGKEVIYTVLERGEASAVASFEQRGDELVLTGVCDEIGADPCYVIEDPLTGTLMSANYSDGSVSVYSFDGRKVGERLQQVQLEGSGPVAGRQESAHAHQLKIWKGESGIRYLLVSDLGSDCIRIFEIDERNRTVKPETQKLLSCGMATGPRHMEFNADSTRLYCITELSGELLVFDMTTAESPTAHPRPIQRIIADTLFAGGSADIHIHPAGRYIYTSHRLKGDGISTFELNSDGTVRRTGYCPTGAYPRNFAITPDGSKILVACRDADSIEVYDINPADGSLSPAGSSLIFSGFRPSCVVIR